MKQAKVNDKLKKQNSISGTIEVTQPCLYVLDFKGSMDAHEVTSLREKISEVPLCGSFHAR